MAFGYAAQRGSICVVRGLEDWFDRRSSAQLLAFPGCVLWVIVVAAPLVWVDPHAHLARAYPAGLAAAGGGALFGVGAALNGSCSFGTITRLGSGDLSCLGTLAGIGGGYWLQMRRLPTAPAPLGPSLLEAPSLPGGLIVFAALASCIWMVRRARLRDGTESGWSPGRAAVVMGVSGGILYTLIGSWSYTVALQRSVAAMTGAPVLPPVIALVFAGCVAGAALGAERGHRFRLRLAPRSWPTRLAGGTVMGIGAAYVPGGNDALLLHGAPALSPHVLIAYPALLAGAGAALFAARAIRRANAAMMAEAGGA